MSPHEELFHRLLDDSSTLLAAPSGAGIAIPDDELHREIIVPLLPAMLGDKSIRRHWCEQAATGFPARIGRHFENGGAAPHWLPGDFEIHVTASYSAGPDARALADTLLSEESLREMTASLMNQLLDALWPSLVPALPDAAPVAETAPPKPLEKPAPPEPAAAGKPPSASGPQAEIPIPQALPREAPPLTADADLAAEPQISARRSRVSALVQALCRKLPSPADRRKLTASTAGETTGAILARRILGRAERGRLGQGSAKRAGHGGRRRRESLLIQEEL